MEFFNKKEEVIDLQITQYGRYLLSRGRFKPVYYAFFDENILYNVSNANISEAQNESEERINATPTMHPQVGFSSLEREFQNNYNLVLSGKKEAWDQSIQRTPEKLYLLPQPIGTSDINAEYAPSWSIRFLNGTLSGSVDHTYLKEKNAGVNILKIPQLSSKTTIEVTSITGGDFEYDEALDSPLESDFGIVTDEDNTYVIMKLIENNGLYQKKNFDIELFEVYEEESGIGKATATLMAGTNTFNDAVIDSLSSVGIDLDLTLTNTDGTTHTITLTKDDTSKSNMDAAKCNTRENLAAELKAVLDLAVAAGDLKMEISSVTKEKRPTASATATVITLTQSEAGTLGDRLITGTLISRKDLYVNNTDRPLWGYFIAEHTPDFITKKGGLAKFSGGSGAWIETLRPLNFSKPHQIEDELTFMGAPDPRNDQDHVEYYFEVRVDDEIADQVLCRLDPESVNEKLGVHADARTIECQDELNLKKKKTVGDIYVKEGAVPNDSSAGAGSGSGRAKPGDSDSPGEIC